MNVPLREMNPHPFNFSHFYCAEMNGHGFFFLHKDMRRKPRISLIYDSQNQRYNKFSLPVLQPGLYVCFPSTDKERIWQQRGACIPSEEDLHANSRWGGTETGTAGEIHAGWYVFHEESAFSSRHRLPFDLMSCLNFIPSYAMWLFLSGFEFSSLTVYVDCKCRAATISVASCQATSKTFPPLK